MNRELSNTLVQLERSPKLQLFHVEFQGLALGTRNDATQVSVEVADTLSVVEPIPGKQGWLIYPIKRLFDEENRLPVGSGEKNSEKDASRAIQR